MTPDPQNPFEGHVVLEKLDSPEHNAAVEKRLAEYHAREAELKAIEATRVAERSCRLLWEARGELYRQCTLDNFKVTDSRQEPVLGQIRRLADNLDAEIRVGTNLLLTGDPGTGKDHLLAALMTTAMAGGHVVKWTSGAMLFSRLRDAIDAHENEYAVARQYTVPAVLAISDPAWERGALTKYQRDKLGDIIDTRYNHCRPTWITLNAKDRSQANDLLGEALVDRLRDGALSLGCNWPSYRKPRA